MEPEWGSQQGEEPGLGTYETFRDVCDVVLKYLNDSHRNRKLGLSLKTLEFEKN